jgi:hypothetical protein
VFGHRVAGFTEKAFNGEPSTRKSRQSDDGAAYELPAGQHKMRNLKFIIGGAASCASASPIK